MITVRYTKRLCLTQRALSVSIHLFSIQHSAFMAPNEKCTMSTRNTDTTHKIYIQIDEDKKHFLLCVYIVFLRSDVAIVHSFSRENGVCAYVSISLRWPLFIFIFNVRAIIPCIRGIVCPLHLQATGSRNQSWLFDFGQNYYLLFEVRPFLLLFSFHQHQHQHAKQNAEDAFSLLHFNTKIAHSTIIFIRIPKQSHFRALWM